MIDFRNCSNGCNVELLYCSRALQHQSLSQTKSATVARIRLATLGVFSFRRSSGNSHVLYLQITVYR